MYLPKLIICLREGYTLKQFRGDLGAGLIVGLVALPLGMAFAIASGLPPERGLYTAIIAGFLISVLGGSRVQIGGPTGAFVVIVAGVAAKFGYPGLALATMMAGAILILMGLSRLGDMVKYIPYPVTTGFTSGIAVVIFSSQVRDFLGLQMTHVPADFLAKWSAFFHAAGSINLMAVAISVVTVLIITRWPKTWQKVPGPVAALVLTTFCAWFFQLPVETIGSRFGGIPSSLPRPALPAWSWSMVQSLVQPATTIALLASIESLLSAVVADGMIGTRHKSNTELVAQGVANIVSPLFGGLPATGAIARTATNIKNGGRTPIAGMIHAVVLLGILMTAGPLAAKVPLATLAGILVVVSYHMSEWRSFQFILSGPGSDVVVLLTTFGLTVLVDLTVAVEVGMILAALLFMKNMAELTQVTAFKENGENGDHLRDLVVPTDVQIFTIQGSFFFGAAHKVMEVGRQIAKDPRALILDLTGVLHMDASGLHVLEKIRRDCAARKTRFIIVGMHSQPLLIAQKSGQIESLGVDNFHSTLPLALQDLERRRTPRDPQ